MSEEKTLTGYPSIDKPWLKYYNSQNIQMDMPRQSMYDYIFSKNAGYDDNIALTYFGTKISYKKLFENIDKAAVAFSKMGIRKGDIVSFLSITSPEIVYSLYALNKLGAVCNMIYPTLADKAISKIIEDSHSKLLISMEAFLPKLQAISADICCDIIMVDLKSSMPKMAKLALMLKSKRQKTSLKYIRYENLPFDCDCQVEHINDENLPALIVYTGGTTGEPKGVVLSNRNVNAFAFQYERNEIPKIRTNTWQLPAAPFIAYVTVCAMHAPLSFGLNCILIIYNPDTIASDIVKKHYNCVSANPLVWETVIKLPKAQKTDFSSLVAPICGADYLNPKLEENINSFLKEHGCKYSINQGYGLSEVASGISVNMGGAATRIGSVGLPFIDTVVSVFDVDSGKELKYNETGEICICGPSVMLGYYHNQKATDEVIKKHEDGLLWLHSGDLGHIDKDGFIFIDGRIKRMFVRFNGAKVFPPVIEQAILKSDFVEKAAVIGIPERNHADGYIPIAFVVLNNRCSTLQIKQELESLCAENIAEYMIPQEWFFVDDLPKTPVGKVDYRALEKQIAEK